MHIDQLYRLAAAERETGIKAETLRSAILRGELKTYRTACGLPLVTLAAVRTWAAKERIPGRKPKDSTS